MPRRADRYPDGVLVPNPQPIALQEGQITAQAVQEINQHQSTIASKLNGGISAGNGESGTRAGNLDGRWITVLTPPTPDTEFKVFHGLGRLPAAVLPAIKGSAAHVYSSSEGSWSSTVLFLKCDVGGVTLRLLIL